MPWGFSMLKKETRNYTTNDVTSMPNKVCNLIINFPISNSLKTGIVPAQGH